MHGSAPNDDTVRFTLQTGWPPALVVALAAAILVGGAAVAWWSLGGRDELRALGRTRSELLSTDPRDVVGVTAALVGLFLIAGALHAWSGGAAADAGVATEVPPPPSHAPLFDVRVDGSSVDTTFPGGVAHGETVFLVLRFEELAGGPFRVTLIDSAGEEHARESFDTGTTMGVASSRPRVAPQRTVASATGRRGLRRSHPRVGNRAVAAGIVSTPVREGLVRPGPTCHTP